MFHVQYLLCVIFWGFNFNYIIIILLSQKKKTLIILFYAIREDNIKINK